MAEVQLSSDQIEHVSNTVTPSAELSVDQVEFAANTVLPEGDVSADHIEFLFDTLTQAVDLSVDQIEELHEGPLVTTRILIPCIKVSQFKPGPRKQGSSC